jgi:hypothetical protein
VIVSVLRYLQARGRRRHWSVRLVRGLTLVSAGAMAWAAATANSDHHIRADGTKAPRGERIEGDPGGKPSDDVGQRKDAGAKSDPDSDANPLDEAGTAAS